MTTHRVRAHGRTTVHLRCDQEGCGRTYDTGANSAAHGRGRAERDGWAWKRQPSGMMADLCPDHALQEDTHGPEGIHHDRPGQ